MSAYVYSTFEIRIIMYEVLILSVYALTHCGLEKVREHEHQKVKHIFLLIVVIKVEQVERKHSLQHIMKKIIVTSSIESGLYL